jgi:molybdopterin converting factor small subunit
MEAEGTGYWEPWLGFVDTLERQGMISPDDKNLFTFTTSVEEACAEIRRFYNNYHSQRYVKGKLVLRLKHEPTESLVSRLNDEFADIIVNGAIEKIEPTAAEIADGDNVDLSRVILAFDRRHLGRLRMLIDRLNEEAADEGMLPTS